jgi:hypothetical protein
MRLWPFRRKAVLHPWLPWCDRVVLAEVGSAEAAPSLVPCAIEAVGARASAVAARIEELILAHPVVRLPSFDASVRQVSEYRGAWFRATGLHDVLPRHLPEREDTFLCLALCHPSGYVREPAIREAARRLRADGHRRHDVLALGLMLLRRNDWVDAVARTAETELERLLVDDLAEVWTRVLPLVDRLGRFERRAQTTFLDAVRRAFRSPRWSEALRDQVRCGDVATARSAMRRALDADAVSRTRAITTGLVVKDPVVRLFAARAFREAPTRSELDEVLARLEADPYAPLRREALWIREAELPDTVETACRSLLFDRSIGVRTEAQRQVLLRGGDPAAAYRARLGRGASGDAATSLLGLAEVGIPDDAAIAAPFLGARRARTRAAALRCVSRHAGVDHLDAFVDGLTDASPRVSRAASAALHGRLQGARVDRVLALLERPSHPHVRRIAVRLLFTSDPWAALAPLVRSLRDAAEGRGAWAETLLRSWFTRHKGWSTPPPARYVAALREAVDEAGAEMDSHMRQELEFLLRTVTRS